MHLKISGISMKVLIQRVTRAHVEINSSIVGKITHGLLVFLGIEKSDDESIADRMVQRLLKYRVFSDENGKMNLNVQEVNGSLLIISQFTLVAETKKGSRPGFSKGASPDKGRALYEYFIRQSKLSIPIATGEFGADMKVSLENDGPVTFLLELN